MLDSARMGKRRRQEKLERRATVVAEHEASRFSWRRYAGSLLKVLPKMLLLVLAAVVLQIVAVEVLGLRFLNAFPGQLIILLPLYFLMFRWINRDLVPPGRRPTGRPVAKK